MYKHKVLKSTRTLFHQHLSPVIREINCLINVWIEGVHEIILCLQKM